MLRLRRLAVNLMVVLLPKTVVLLPKPEVKDVATKSANLVFAFCGSDAQTQTSCEDTLFQIGLTALRKFNASFQDV